MNQNAWTTAAVEPIRVKLRFVPILGKGIARPEGISLTASLGPGFEQVIVTECGPLFEYLDQFLLLLLW
jgi:hypothetical protein